MTALVLVRANIRLPEGPPPGTEVLVDPALPFIAACIEADYLTPLPPALQPIAEEAPMTEIIESADQLPEPDRDDGADAEAPEPDEPAEPEEET